MSYSAIVSKIKVRPHPNADRLQLGTCYGNQVVVGLDTQDGQLGIFFPTDGQLSHDFCVANNLYTKSARQRLGLPEAPEGSVGFFDHNRRVRAQRFRQEASDGLWMPLNCLEWTGEDPTKLEEGNTLVEWGGYELCQKYYTPATLRSIAARGVKKRECKCFPKHDDTTQFRFVADSIPEDSILYITEKLHGTSGRYGHVYDEVPITSFWGRLRCAILNQKASWQGWRYLNGSRNVILEKTQGEGYYGTNDFRYQSVEGVTLHKGEILYFEIVGWVNEDSPIMPPHDASKTGLDEIKSRYGNTISYTYGCPKGTHRIYVYKILNVNEDGVARELPFTQMVARCGELGLEPVPLLDGPITFRELGTWPSPAAHSGNPTAMLRHMVESYTEGCSTLDTTQIREGVVLRVESSKGIQHIKNKQWAFGVLEGFWKEQTEAVDLEEVS